MFLKKVANFNYLLLHQSNRMEKYQILLESFILKPNNNKKTPKKQNKKQEKTCVFSERGIPRC